MSTDPTGLDGGDYESSIDRTYMNVKVTRKDWCTYEGECLIDNVIFNKDDLCSVCRYRKMVDIPTLLFKRQEEIKKQKGTII